VDAAGALHDAVYFNKYSRRRTEKMNEKVNGMARFGVESVTQGRCYPVIIIYTAALYHSWDLTHRLNIRLKRPIINNCRP
jgi:hypothetical protein